MSVPDPDEQRARLREGWERAASGWAASADRVRRFGMPVSMWLIEHLRLQPGMRVLELAAGPGDTGFLAAEIVAPGGGVVISSDGAEAMVEVARRRAAELGIRGVEFRQLELEWIDLPAADVDRVVCRWGVMLIVDPAACVQECRRVLRPGGRIALAVWDAAERNPWATIPSRALVELGHADPPPPAGPGMFALGDRDRLLALLETAGFTEIEIEAVAVERRHASAASFLEDSLTLSAMFAGAWNALEPAAQEAVGARITELLEPFTGEGGAVVVPGCALVAAASA